MEHDALHTYLLEKGITSKEENKTLSFSWNSDAWSSINTEYLDINKNISYRLVQLGLRCCIHIFLKKNWSYEILSSISKTLLTKNSAPVGYNIMSKIFKH